MPVSKPITSQENKSTVSRTLVTLEDLKKVKLKKVKQADEKDKENTEPESKKIGFKLNKSDKQNDKHCLVTLRDLKSVRLKKNKEDDSLEKIRLRTPEEMVVMRRSLRKVNISRSPGGTPVVSDKALEHGTGLTPMMTRALRKKFQHAHPYSSPDSPSKRQSLSPMTIRSPKAQKVLSPLSFR
ncbi:Proline-rich protein 11 [Stylophora pistillata]|uniref:Proline-rich protein 11 n=1 Tax=Stylophora pistillata TaxID=50429 RepID=A0A2B4RKK6_STYPI|nr:Proline-rich protein 11 [Stylophora pistillata]